MSAHCHVWTSDPADAAGLSFDAAWDERVDGLSARAEAGVVVVTAAGDARRDVRGVLAVTADGSEPGLLRFVVTGGPPPSLSPIRISDMRSGQSRILDLAPYLRPGVGDPVPTVLEARQLTDLDVDIDIVSASEVRITTGPDVAGTAEFQVVMSDVARADADPDRRVEGRISLDVLDVPDAPAAPVPGNSVVSRQVSLTWAEPDANGAPIDYYEVRASGGPTRRCAATACEIGGLTNGRAYTFQVRAHNAVGFSDWSGSSRPATPDEKPGLVGPIRNTRVADRTLVIAWNPPATTDVDHRPLRRDLRRDQPQDLATRGDDHRARQQHQVLLQGVRRERRGPRPGAHLADLPVPGPGRHPRGTHGGGHAHVELGGDGGDQLGGGAAQRPRTGQLPGAAQR